MIKSVAKQIFSFIFLLGCVDVSAQTGAQANPNNYERVRDVLPPAPNAAALGKYGGIDVSLNNGSMSKTIPLYTFSYRGINVPISVSYNTTGFKVDEIASRVGHGWVLNAGGAITRNIVGIADEMGTRAPLPAGLTIDQASYDYLEGLAQSIDGSGGVDAQPDIFSFNFNGYTGKFIFDENMNVVLLPAGNLKIEKDFSESAPWTFKVTTPDGFKYYFGGDSATEKTRRETSCGKPAGISYLSTAWYLFKIENVNGEHINFVYEDCPEFVFRTTLTETLNYNYPSNAQLTCTGDNPVPGVSCQSVTNTSCYTVLRSHGVFLKEINTPKGGKIVFSFTNRFDVGDKLIAGIVVKDYNDADKFNFGFEYQHITSTLFSTSYDATITRPFLVKIKENAISGGQVKEHKFSYNNLDQLPVQITRAQDHWGYFNGKSNSSLVEKPWSFDLQERFPTALANRNPDALFAKKGILSRIDYPTGGWENIYYESNKYRGSKIIRPPSTTADIFVTGTGLHNQEIANSNQFVISENQYAKLIFTVFDNSTPENPLDPAHNMGSVSLIQVGGSPIFNSNSYVADDIERTQVVYVGPGTYYLKVTANGAVVTTSAHIYYSPGTSSAVTDNYDCGGVRVAKIESFDGISSLPQVKKFYYNSLATPAVSSGAEQPEPNYYKPEYFIKKYCDMNYDPCAYSALYSNALNNLNIYPGGSSYATVVEGFGENFENGAIEHNFRIAEDAGPGIFNPSGEYLYGAPYSNNSRSNGQELSQTIYKKNNSGSLVPVKKIINTYKNDTRRFQIVVGVAVNKKYMTFVTGGGALPVVMQAFDAAQYNLASSWEYIEKTDELIYDENGANPVTTTTRYYYDNDQHLQLTRTEIPDSKGQLLSTVQKYPGDFASLSATDALTAGVKNLKEKNITGPVIEKSVYRKNNDGSNERLISSALTVYRIDNAMPSYISQTENVGAITNFVPAYVSAGAIIADSRYKQQLLFENYDANANLVQQANNNNIKLSYVWGYNSAYPIAQAVNAKANEIFFDGFEETGTWDGIEYDASKSHTGKYSAKITNTSGNELTWHSLKWLNISLTAATKFKYSGWIYTNGPSAEIFFFMKRAGETGYFTNVNSIVVSEANKWIYVEGEYEVPADITQLNIRIDNNGSGTVWFDDIRLHPSAAQMITNTYEPLIGMTSQTDINNRPTYYEYDGLGRLSLIRDQDRNIIKKIEYQYNVYTHTNAVWESTGNLRCKPCPANTNYFSTTQQREEKDINSQSATYNQVRWIDIGVTDACNPLADWQNTATPVRCKTISGIYTGEQEQEQKDMNPCNDTYNQTRWVVTGTNCITCPKPANWQSTGNYRCVKNPGNNNTGYQEREERDNETCSSTYNQTRWVSNGYNITACPLPVCNSSNCSGENKRCVWGNCETGVKIYTNSQYVGPHQYICTYHYEWSDGYWSQNYTENSINACINVE